MPEPADILKELHRLRRHIKDLDGKIEQAPKQLTAQRNKLAKQEDTLKLAHETIKQLTLKAREKELSVKATTTQIVKYEKQLESAVAKKEYDTLKLEIKQEKEHISKLEDEILAAMTEIDERNVQLPEVDKATQKARADFAQFEIDFKERLERFAGEKTRAAEALTTTESTLPEDVRLQYNRLLAAKGMDALIGVNGKTCMACYTEITSQMISELNRGVFMMCKNCGRMLYMES